jgi:hypothetical protein
VRSDVYDAIRSKRLYIMGYNYLTFPIVRSQMFSNTQTNRSSQHFLGEFTLLGRHENQLNLATFTREYHKYQFIKLFYYKLLQIILFYSINDLLCYIEMIFIMLYRDDIYYAI